MIIINLTPCENGAHANQTISFKMKTLPKGWAAVPAELEADAAAILPWVTLTVKRGKITAIAENAEAKLAHEAELARIAAEETEKAENENETESETEVSE